MARYNRRYITGKAIDVTRNTIGRAIRIKAALNGPMTRAKKVIIAKPVRLMMDNHLLATAEEKGLLEAMLVTLR